MTAPITPGTELDTLLRCVAVGLGRLATAGYAAGIPGSAERGGRAARAIPCATFGGRLTPELIDKLSVRNPGLVVSITGVAAVSRVGDGGVDLSLEFSGAIVTQCAVAWDPLGARVLQAVLTGIHGTNWNTSRPDAENADADADAQPSCFLFPRITGLAAERVFGKDSIAAGVTLWTFTWRQDARLPGAPLVHTADDSPGGLRLRACPPYGLAAGANREDAEDAYTRVENIATDWPSP